MYGQQLLCKQTQEVQIKSLTESMTRCVCIYCTAHNKAHLCNIRHCSRPSTTVDVDQQRFLEEDPKTFPRLHQNVHLVDMDFPCLICSVPTRFQYVQDALQDPEILKTSFTKVKHTWNIIGEHKSRSIT